MPTNLLTRFLRLDYFTPIPTKSTNLQQERRIYEVFPCPSSGFGTTSTPLLTDLVVSAILTQTVKPRRPFQASSKRIRKWAIDRQSRTTSKPSVLADEPLVIDTLIHFATWLTFSVYPSSEPGRRTSTSYLIPQFHRHFASIQILCLDAKRQLRLHCADRLR